MANNNTIKRINFGTDPKGLAALAIGASTTQTSYSTNGVTLGGNTVVAVAPGIIRIADLGQVPMYWDNGRPFAIKAWGTITTGVSETATLTLFQVPLSILGTLASGSVTSCNSVKASSARTIATATAAFYMEAKMNWNATSGILQGQTTFEINNLVDAWAATTAVTTATLFDTELNFILALTMGTGNAADTSTLQEMAIEPL